jgi:hypothetical protein
LIGFVVSVVGLHVFTDHVVGVDLFLSWLSIFRHSHLLYFLGVKQPAGS